MFWWQFPKELAYDYDLYKELKNIDPNGPIFSLNSLVFVSEQPLKNILEIEHLSAIKYYTKHLRRLSRNSYKLAYMLYQASKPDNPKKVAQLIYCICALNVCTFNNAERTIDIFIKLSKNFKSNLNHYSRCQILISKLITDFCAAAAVGTALRASTIKVVLRRCGSRNCLTHSHG